jgi:hypothetical protein
LVLTARKCTVSERRDAARALRTAAFTSRQQIADFETKLAESALWTRRIAFFVLIGWNDGIVAFRATPVVWTTAVFVVHWDATFPHTLKLKQLNVAVEFDAVLVLRNWFVLEVFRADTFVTFEILAAHSFAFFVGFSFKLTRSELLGLFI